MVQILLWILLVTFLDGLVALVGIFSLLVSKKWLSKILILLVAFSAGALLSGGLLHLLLESLEKLSNLTALIYFIFGFLIFFFMEKFLYWHHCRKYKQPVRPYTYLILFGDGIHNFIDGLIIAASFLININFGLVTTTLIITHEIPQELGDFGVLVYGGMKKVKALIYNFISQLTCIIGGVLGYFMLPIQNVSVFMLPFAAGGFIYISASDLIPELQKEEDIKKILLSILFFLIGIGFIILMKLVLG